jgi:endonuclease/exonuclease/phosphatase family metal-dependent hydrolase
VIQFYWSLKTICDIGLGTPDFFYLIVIFKGSPLLMFSFFLKKYFMKCMVLVILLGLTFSSLDSQKIKVIAYNIEFAKNTTPEQMVSLLEQEKADIICFNEVPGQGWTKKVGDLLGLNYSFEGQIASANHMKGFDDKTKKYYGKYKSILSKFPLDQTHEITLNGIGWSPATAVIATTKIGKKQSIKIFSLHIPTGVKNASNSKAFHLAQYIKSEYSDGDKMIVAGDFNDLVGSEPMLKLYGQGLKNPWKVLNMDLSDLTTFPNSKTKGYVIDHVLFTGLELKSAGIIDEEILSDHKPVWSVFKL